MPIDHDLLGLQRRDVPLGEIRIGYSVEIPGKKGRQPKRSDTFRFTTAVEFTADAVAAKLGGKVAPWSRRKGYFEVITDRTSLNVWVPPRSLAVDANMELWADGKRQRQCTGRAMSFPPPEQGEPPRPCMCPADPAERGRLAAMRPPKACKPKTRITVSMPELPGLTGVWTLYTGSASAAVETTDSGDAMALARAGGAYLPAILFIHWRFRLSDGSPYPVPVLMIGTSMEELARGELPAGPGGLLAQLQGSGETRAAIEAPHPAIAVPSPAAAQAPPQPRPAATVQPDDQIVDAEIVDDDHAAQDSPPLTAQQIWDIAAMASTPHDIEVLIGQAQENRVQQDPVQVDGTDYGNLLPALMKRRRELASAA